MRAELLLGFCLFAAGYQPQVDSCQYEKLVGTCVEILKRLPEKKIIYTTEEIQNTCKLIDDFLVCFNETGCQAVPAAATVAETTRLSVKYICEDHFDEYLKHERCINSENMNKSLDFCVEEATPLEYQPCKEKNFMHSCYVKSIRGCCGIDAANIADGFVKVIRQRSSSSDDCQMQPDSAVPDSPYCKSRSSMSVYNVFVVSLAFILSFSLKLIEQ